MPPHYADVSMEGVCGVEKNRLCASRNQRLADFLRDETAFADAGEEDGSLAVQARLHRHGNRINY